MTVEGAAAVMEQQETDVESVEPVADPNEQQAPAEEVEAPSSEASARETVETADEADDRLSEWHDQVKLQREKVRDRQEKVDDLSESLKAAKKKLEEATEELLRIIDEDEENAPTLPFKKSGGATTGESKAAPTTSADPEAWRSATLEDLGIDKIKRVGKKAVEILTESELTTLGAICDYTNANKRICDLPDIGPAAVQGIEDAIDKYWVDHPQPKKTEEATAVEEPEQAGEPEPGAASDNQPTTVHCTDVGQTPQELKTIALLFNPRDAKKDKKPHAPLIVMGDDKAIPVGEYVIVGKNKDTFTLLPVRDHKDWLELVGRIEREKHCDPPGEFAGKVVLDKSDPKRELYIGCDTEAVLVSIGQKILSISDIGLNPGDIEANCHAGILVKSNYAGGGPIQDIDNAIRLGDGVYIVTPPPVIDGGSDAGVYALRPLVKPTNEGEVKDDAYLHRQMNFEGVLYEIGPVSDVILVRDGK